MPAGTGPQPDPAGNVADLLRAAASAYPERPAIIEPAGSRTWAELDRATDAAVAGLRAHGLPAGERVLIALPTGADLALALFAAARAGLIAVPVGPGRGDVDAIADRITALASIGGDGAPRLPITIGAAERARWWRATAGPQEHPGAHGEDLAILARAASDRAVMLSHRSILAAVRAIGALAAPRLRDADRALQVLPMYHVAGWVVSFLPTALVGGASVVPALGFDAIALDGAAAGALRGTEDVIAAGRRATAAALDAAREHRVTVVPGSPGFYHHLLAIDGAERSLSAVRILTSGTAPLDPADFAEVRTIMGQPVWEGYGLSESSSVATSTLMTAAPRHGSVGRPVHGVELRIIGPDGRDLLAEPEAGPVDDEAPSDPLDSVTPDAGEVGRIALRGDTLFSGYWPDGGGGPDAEGWFVSGDVGYLGDDGELRLVDRVAEVITVAGFTVYPREIEDVLATHPYVAEAAVIGVPGSGGREDIVAVLVAAPGKRPTAGDMADFASERLPVFKRPVAYHVASSLPRTEVGRLDRGAVRRLHVGPLASPLRLVAEPSPDGRESVAERLPARQDAAGEPAEPDGGDAAAPDATGPDATVPETTGTGPTANDVQPEQVDLEELGTRLPGTGDRGARGRLDSDEDLF
jgi:long-chain acyl-CoA synthetase